MPDTNEGPAGVTPDTAKGLTPTNANPLPGFADAMVSSFGHPDSPPQGEPERATAVETSAEEKAPEPKAEKPTTAPAAEEEKPAPEQTVNFDGFSKEQKETWERLFKAGQVNAQEVERARLESMFQASWTRNHQALSKEREAFKSEMESRREDLRLLDDMRRDDQKYALWLKVARGEISAETPEDPDLLDRKVAANFIDERIAARERERAERTTKEQSEYAKRADGMRSAVTEWMKIHNVDVATAKAYCEAEEAKLPPGVDPLLRYSPEDLTDRLTMRHELESAKKEAARLREQATQRTQQAARASKQSLPPSPRVVDEGPSDPFAKVLRDLGVAHLSDVQGSGFAV